MKTERFASIFFFIAVFAYQILFWKEQMGVNTLLFSGLMISFLFFLYRENGISRAAMVLAGGTLLSGLFVTIHNSALSKFIYIISFSGLVGFVQQKELRFLWYACLLGLANVFETPLKLIRNIKWSADSSRNISKGFRFLKIGLIPLFILGAFYLLYFIANPKFAELSTAFWSNFLWLWNFDLSLWRVFFITFSIFLCAGILLPSQIKSFLFAQQTKTEDLKRQRPLKSEIKTLFSPIALKNEYRAGLFLIYALNVLLLIVNLTDIVYVWFGFDETSPQNLKSYVHEGTYLLIFAILLAMGVLLFFFRKNLNFFPNRKYLLLGAYIWIIQNVILSISVGIRNYHYIDFHGLAYKRIGVIIFLILVCYGLWTMYVKVKEHKSLYFLVSQNAWALYAILFCCSGINWDILITRYNLNVPTKGAIDIDFMLRQVSDKNLFLLKEDYDRLQALDSYPVVSDQNIDHFIKAKEKSFSNRIKKRTWPSWNFSDHRNQRYLNSK